MVSKITKDHLLIDFYMAQEIRIMLQFNVIVFLLVISTSNAYSQNLVLNPSFEDFKGKKKEKLTEIDQLSFCYNPSKGTPDLFNTLMKSQLCKAPNTIIGYQKPHSGDVFVGIVVGNYLKNDGFNRYREYISLELKEPLQQNQAYCIEMYISLANNHNYASDGIGFYLSSENFYSYSEGLLLKNFSVIKPNKYNISNTIITDTANWVRICDTVRAKGGEKFLIIGNFKNDDSTQFVKIHRKTNSYFDARRSYYYIDDVSVTASNGSECNCNKPASVVARVADTVQTIKENRAIVMEQVYFETNKYELLPKSYQYLDSLCLLLSKTTNQIEISGHTDNAGEEKDNQVLSENRAKAVMAYMVSKGISQLRVSATGYGSRKPVASNEAEQGRAQNRRVEFVIVKKKE